MVRSLLVRSILFPCLLLAACATARPHFPTDARAVLGEARANGREVVVFFALPGREQSDRMERLALPAPEVAAALDDGDFASLRLDGAAQKRLYEQWIGGGEGMGLVVLDGDGRPYAARPGPLDPPELAAFVRQCASVRARVLALREAVAAAPKGPDEALALGTQLLELGCRLESEELLLRAAQAGRLEARHRLARLYALDGYCQRARQWLDGVPPTKASDVTLGYVLFKERRHREAAEVLARPAQDPSLGDDRLRACLYLGKALHESGDDAAARVVLQRLSREARGTTFGAAADHTLSHLDSNDHGHTH